MRSLLEGFRTQSTQEFFERSFDCFRQFVYLRVISLIFMEIPEARAGVWVSYEKRGHVAMLRECELNQGEISLSYAYSVHILALCRRSFSCHSYCSHFFAAKGLRNFGVIQEVPVQNLSGSFGDFYEQPLTVDLVPVLGRRLICFDFFAEAFEGLKEGS